MSEIITRETLGQLIDACIGRGAHVAGPRQVKARVKLYGQFRSAADMAWDLSSRPRNSIKQFIFPRHEKLYGYRFEGKRVLLDSPQLPEAEQIVFGARPCDAFALAILDHVFAWDGDDVFYQHRRRLTTVVTFACPTADADCFCTSVDCGPADTRGSDAMLFDLGEGVYEVRCLTEKGGALFRGRTETSDRQGVAGPGPERRLDRDAIGRFLASGYDRPEWAEASRRCLGCGAAPYTCPTCHCFDIVDEGNASGGAEPATGTHVSSPSSRPMPRATIRETRKPHVNGSGFYTSFRSTPRNSDRLSAPAAATAPAIARCTSACGRCWRPSSP